MKGNRRETRSRKVYYRRAVWDFTKTGSQTLEDLMRAAHQPLVKVGSRTFDGRSGAEIRGADIKDEDGFFLHVASYIPDEPTSTIQGDAELSRSLTVPRSAPIGEHYLSGDVFVFIKGNDVVLCASGARETLATDYICHILLAANLSEVASTFGLEKVAKLSSIEMIRAEGVRSIMLHASLYEASRVHMESKSPTVSGLYGAIAKQLEAMFSADDQLSDISDKENLNMTLSLSFDRQEARSKYNKHDLEFGVAGKERLKRTAEQLVSSLAEDDISDAGYTIITQLNNKITSDSILVSDSYQIKTNGKSLDVKHAWLVLKAYYGVLRENGVLRQ